MNSKTKIVQRVIVYPLAFFGVIFIALIVYYFPVIDRLFIRPCHYFPETFIDCR